MGNSSIFRSFDTFFGLSVSKETQWTASLDDEVDDALRGPEAVLGLADEDGGVLPARLPQQEPGGQSARGLLVLNL